MSSFEGATHRETDKSYTSPSNWTRSLLPWALHHQAPGTSLLSECPLSAATQGGTLLTKNDDHAVLDGLDFCL